LVSGVVAGDDLGSVAAAASEALGRGVAIAIPALGEPVVSRGDAIGPDDVRAIVEHALAVVRGEATDPPTVIADAVLIRTGGDVVGIVAAARGSTGPLSPEDRSWLDAAAAAAAVAALMLDAQEGGLEGSRRALLHALRAGPPADVASLVGHARRLGFDLSAGAVAFCALTRPGQEPPATGDLAQHPALLAEMGAGRVYGLLPLNSRLGSPHGADDLAAELASRGMQVALSTPRRNPEALHEALREAELLVELDASPDAALPGQEETYRLLIGVLLRDPEELERLRAGTISPVSAYDEQHDTELLATLQAFLAHHGSTTETAEALSFHRHTVGYRLARVHEVSGLSPYESDGRERLSLGLKAHHILQADARLRD
jgi:hypothetical protein